MGGELEGVTLNDPPLQIFTFSSGIDKRGVTVTVISNGAVIVGTVLSFTVTVCVAVAMFPALSVTVQVTVVVPNGNTVGALLLTEATLQLSEVIGVPNVTLNATQELFALTTKLTGATIVGFCVSITVTVKLAVLVFPAASVAVYVTVVVPSENTSPELCVLVIVTPAQLSVIVGVVQVAVALQFPVLLLMIRFAGIFVITGAKLSTTVIN